MHYSCIILGVCIRYSYHNNATTEGIPHSPHMESTKMGVDANASWMLLAAFSGSYATHEVLCNTHLGAYVCITFKYCVITLGTFRW